MIRRSVSAAGMIDQVGTAIATTSKAIRLITDGWHRRR